MPIAARTLSDRPSNYSSVYARPDDAAMRISKSPLDPGADLQGLSRLFELVHESARRRVVGDRPRVVIVGAGVAGMAAARALAGCEADVLLVDRREDRFAHADHGGASDIAAAAQGANREAVRSRTNVEVINAEVGAIDPIGGTLRMVEGDQNSLALPFDYLVLAVGDPTAARRDPEVAPDAALLTTFDPRRAIEARLEDALECAGRTKDPLERSRLLTFVIIGGGRKGVGMAATVDRFLKAACIRDGRRIDPYEIKVVLFEAGPRILPQLDPVSSALAERRLKRLDVQIRTSADITWVDRFGVAVGEVRTYSATVIWTGAVSPALLVNDACWRTDGLGRAMVGSNFQVVGHSGVFVIGDAAVVMNEGCEKFPTAGPSVAEQGRYVGELIGRPLGGAQEPGLFRCAMDEPNVQADAARLKPHPPQLGDSAPRSAVRRI